MTTLFKVFFFNRPPLLTLEFAKSFNVTSEKNIKFKKNHDIVDKVTLTVTLTVAVSKAIQR